MKANKEIREAIDKKRLKHYEVAAACGINQCTLSHWLQTELKPEKKKKILEIIENYEW